MGKHKKIVNDDPIVKKDYKYEKRKKLRAEEKEAERERIRLEKKAKQQIAQIQYEVKQEIETELQMHRATQKKKSINKIPRGLITSKTTCRQKNIKPSTINKEFLQLRKPSEQQQKTADHYKRHYSEIDACIIREQAEDKKDVLDRQIRGEIKSMFGVKEENQMETKKSELDLEYSSPYVLIKVDSPQKQVVISGELHLMSAQAYNRKQCLTDEGNVQRSIIKSYFDYVYIQNQEEQSIQEFRQIVIDHIISHENCCRNEADKSKGFTNAKSLILSPFFGDAKSILEIIEAKYEGYSILNKDKMSEVEDESDFFRFGISINDRKKTIKYFSHFNVSNIIMGSPVGLKAIVGAEGETQRDYSFLSSVQILYIDRASTIGMQNWDHLVEVIKNMNLMPNSESICNSIDTFRPSVPELKGRLYRQSIIFSEYNFPEINCLKFQHFHNYEGCITSKIFYPPPQQSKKQTSFDIQFYKLQLKEPKDDIEIRFDFFKRKFWDELHNNQSMNKVLIFVKSYFEFIKIKQFLIRVNASADSISEHTKKSKVQSKIAQFNAGKFRILLLTERAYYYGVCQIRMIQHLVLYSLPKNSFIYFELLSEIMKEQKYVVNKVVAIYTKYDIMALERVMGTRKAIEMVKQYCSNVSFIV